MGKYERGSFDPRIKRRGPDSVNVPPGLLTPITDPTGSGRDLTRPEKTAGVLKFWSPELGLTATTRTKEAPQVVQERAGGWQEVARPTLRPVPWREGTNLLKVKFVLWLDGWGNTVTSVQPAIDTLRRFGYNRTASSGSTDPVTLEVVGDAPYASGGILDGSSKPTTWVVDSLEIVENHHFSGAPVQATATMVLLEYIDARSSSGRAKATKARKYKWRSGDRLSIVAERELGSADKSVLIRKANPKIKVWSKVKAGDSITIPGTAA